MATATVTSSTTDTSRVSEAAILSGLIRPDDGSLTPEAVEGLLGIKFERRDLDRMHELAVKNQDGVLAPPEGTEMENYRNVGFLLDLMHSKARRALKKHRAVHMRAFSRAHADAADPIGSQTA
jgi:hypothetical protein